MICNETVHVSGMYCTNCERRIEESLRSLGVLTVAASYGDGTVQVSYDDKRVSRTAIERAIRSLDYEVAESSRFNSTTASLLVILLALYVIASHLGWLSFLNAFPLIETTMSYGAVFVVGLLTSVHCIAMCGGINLTQSTYAAQEAVNLSASNLLYNLGRVCSYTLIGGLVGALGSVFALSATLKGAISIVAGALMLLMALQMLGVFQPLRKLNLHLPRGFYRALSRRTRGRSTFFVGLLNGLMPCGPLQAMQVYALSTGSAFRGALSMFLFALGTVPLMFGFGFFAGKLNRRYLKYMLSVSAILIFILGLNMTQTGLTLAGQHTVSIPKVAAAPQKAVVSGEVQKVTSTVDYGSYEAIEVKKGIPVQWNLYVPEGRLNGCNGEVLVPEFDIDLTLQEGDNLITFLPEEAGTIPFSCWMGMINSTITVLE